MRLLRPLLSRIGASAGAWALGGTLLGCEVTSVHTAAPADAAPGVGASTLARVGEGSTFHDTFGYHGQGGEQATATLPDGSKDGLVLVTGPGMRFIEAW